MNFDPFIFCFGVLALTLVLFVVVFPRKAIVILLITSFFQIGGYAARFMGSANRIMVWMPFFIAGIIFITLIPAYCSIRGQNDRNLANHFILRYLVLFVFVLGFLSFVSMNLNAVPLITSVFGLRHIILLTIFSLIIIYYNRPHMNIINFARFIVYLSLIQVPFCILQRLLVFFRYSGYSDAITGTFETYSGLIFVQLFAFGISFVYWARYKKVLVGNSFISLATLILLPMFISNARAAFIFLPVLFIFLAIFHWNFLIKKMHYILFLTVIFLFGLIGIFGHLQNKDYQRTLKNEYSYSNIMEYITREKHLEEGRIKLGRLSSIFNSYNLINKNTATLLLGYGSGSTQPSAFLERNGYLYEKYRNFVFIRNQLSLILSEHGLLGISAYLLFFIGVGFQIKRICTKESRDVLFLQDVYGILIVISALTFFYEFPFSTIPLIFIYAYFIAVANHYSYKHLKLT